MDFCEGTVFIWFYYFSFWLPFFVFEEIIRRVPISHCLAFGGEDVHQGVSQPEPSGEKSTESKENIWFQWFGFLFVPEFRIEPKALCIASKPASTELCSQPFCCCLPPPQEVWTCLLWATEQFGYVTLTESGPWSPGFKVPIWCQFIVLDINASSLISENACM